MPRHSRRSLGRNTADSRRYRNARAIETPLQSETGRSLRRLRYSEARVAATQTMQVPVQRIQLWTQKPFSEEHERRYNAPMTNEVALLMVGQEFGPRDIVLHCRNNLTQRISEIHQAYDPLQYPLIFCPGEVGYSVSLPQVNPSTREIMQKTVSCMNFYAYRMMARAGEFNLLLRYGMLTNQFWVDMYAKVETERLSFIRRNQKKLRTENYIHLQDALRADENLANIGQIVILPSSFTGGPRYMHERTQDAMTYVFVRQLRQQKMVIPDTEDGALLKVVLLHRDVLGRVYTVHPTNAECYSLRLLLFHIRGPCSFQSMRTVEGVIHTTFQMACKALGLLEDDSHWNETLKEASICRNAASVRAFFFLLIPSTRGTGHDNHGLARFFLDAPGGTGKTFIINLLLAKLRLEGLVVCAAASSGIAATLLDGGRTAHSLFKLPLNLYDDELAVCNIAKQSATSKILQHCSLFIWDECTMAHRRSIEALDRTLKDLRDNNSIMGGVTFLFVGDSRQTLPVIPKGTRTDEVNACLKRSNIWSSIVKLSLTINMRSHLFGDRGISFSQLLLELGNGTFATHEGLIYIASSDLCVLVEDIHTLISSVYPNIGSLLTMPLSWFSERALLAPRNDAVDKINEYILGKFIAPSRTYLSIDTVVDPNDSVHYPIEFLNSINPPGMPVHSLTLKVGAPIILLRNLNPPKLCNGIRLQVNSLHRYLLEATILTGCGTGEGVAVGQSSRRRRGEGISRVQLVPQWKEAGRPAEDLCVPRRHGSLGREFCLVTTGPAAGRTVVTTDAAGGHRTCGRMD
ncbi:hypothetical protein LAZ67_3005188 [Cordylochernes scorpioides]|uniref:ATP-dependent DNA helicase n=1 Tax=Cordylochernes scorpioides TaxID=51811 RepID=A0ABY6KB65_9ARAC|nr:hypothetical protein LAZ67_3005188 [Cordylochernes scorpioides]